MIKVVILARRSNNDIQDYLIDHFSILSERKRDQDYEHWRINKYRPKFSLLSLMFDRNRAHVFICEEYIVTSI